MYRRKFDVKKKILYVLTFIIPILIMLVIYAKVGITPFGDKSVMTSDMNAQYVSFFSYFKENLNDLSNLEYSFSKLLGGGMIGLMAYYLASPLNLILLFFNTNTIIFGIELITLIKIGLAGLTFCIFLNYSKKVKFSSLIFSTAYALMAYNIIYQFNIMWFDGVILLPLIMIGINKIISEKKFITYMIFLVLAIITNYYIGTMICIFSAIYFIYKYINSLEKINIETIKTNKSKIFMFIIASLLAVMISGAVLIPVLMDLSGGKAEFSISKLLSFNEQFKAMDIYSRVYTASYMGSNTENYMPNIFCGIISIFLVMVYFFNNKRSYKERILSGLVILIFLVSFQIAGINLIWHGFNQPIGFPYRNSFILCAFLLMIANKELEYILENHTNKKPLLIAGIVFVVITILINKLYTIPVLWLYFDIAIVIISGILLYYCKDGNKKKIAIMAIILMMFLDLTINSYFGMKNSEFVDVNKINNFIDQNKPIIDEIKTQDDSFYRIEKDYYYERNDSMLLNYNGISHYSSSEKQESNDFMKKIGYTQSYVWARHGMSNTLAADSLLNIKYLLLKNKKEGSLKYLYSKNDINIYQNQYVLPFSYMVDKKIYDVEINEKNPFELQNNIYKAMSESVKEPIFIKTDKVKEKIINANKSITEEKNISYINNGGIASIEYTINIESSNSLYMFLSEGSTSNAKLYINDKYQQLVLSEEENGIVNIGKYNIEDIVKVKLEFTTKNISYNEPLFYYEDLQVLKEYCENLTKNKLDIKKYDSTYFKGNIKNQEKNKVMFITIPFNKGWKVEVNGKIVETKKVLDIFTTIEIEQGEHEIEIKYTTPGILVGTLISITGIVLLIIYIELNKKKNK